MKRCIKCGVEKELSNFYAHPQMSDGLLGKCKECFKADVRANRSANVTHYQQYDKDRAMKPHRVRARKAYMRTEAGKSAKRVAGHNYATKHAEKRKAQIAVGNAIRDGRLTKQPCEVCGVKKVEAHHDDYSKPLEVRWRCNKHHREIHKHAGK